MGDVPSFGAWLKRRRKALDLTQDALAQRVGCAVVTIRKLEAEVQPPSRQLAERLAEHLAIPEEQRPSFVQFARMGLDAAPPELPLPAEARVPAAPTASPASPNRTRKQSNLPAQLTQLIGREREIAEVCALLRRPDVRLVTLTGPGGIGKTRLALQAATEILDDFRDGAWFVDLAPVGDAALIVPAIAEALRFTFYGQTDPKEQLLGYLSQKQLLVLVDNFEHLLDGADLLSEIVGQAPEVTVLATSRERLHLQEEWVYEVQGLPFPAVNDATTAVSKTSELFDAYAAIQLFVQRARQTEPGFAPSTDEMADIGRICQLVEGMPLGLELAAPWIGTLSCREIAAEIERSLDFLTSLLRNVPQRHRSLRVVFEQTWARLSQAEQAVLMRLSVFRGGCTREAAEMVAGATLPVLSSLVNKALVRRTHLGRYELHELIRQFAEAQLQSEPEAFEQTQQRYQEYFISFLETRTAGVKGFRQKATLLDIKADMDNVRLAWRRAAANRDAQAIERAAECLFVFYLYSSGHYEGQAAFQLAAAAFIEGSDTSTDDSSPDELAILDEQENLVGFVLAMQGYFLARTRDPYAGRALLERAVALLRRVEPRDRRREGFALLWLGWAMNLQGIQGEAQESVQASLPLLSKAVDPWGEGWSLLLWGNSASEIRPTEAQEVLQRALTACRNSGDQTVLGYVSHNLGFVATELGRYIEAKQYIDEAVRIFEELDSKLGLGYAFHRQGELAIPQGEYGQAIQDFQQAIVYFSEVRTVLNMIHCQHFLGTALRLQGDSRQAEQLYRQSLAEATAMNNQNEMAFCLLGLGCLAYDRNELHEAEQLQREALDLWQQIGQEARVAGASCGLGHLMVAAGEQRHAEARQYFRQALELSTRHQIVPIALDVCVGVARLMALRGKTEQAVELLSLAEQHNASTFETRKNARQLLTKLIDQFQSESARAAQIRGQSVDLWAGAHLVLAELAEDQS